MPVKYTLPLIDNEGNTYTAKPGTVKVFNDSPGLMGLVPDIDPITGVITGTANGIATWHFECVSLKGNTVYGSDTVTIADTFPEQDANQMVAQYTVPVA